jgi:hypothetical protein
MLHYAATEFNHPVAVSSYCTPSITNCTGLVVHVGSERLVPIAGTLAVVAVRWSDGKAATSPVTEHVALKAQDGVTYQYNTTAFATILSAAGCATLSDCFIKLTLTDGSGADVAPVTFQWLTLWKDAKLAPANLTVVDARAGLSGDSNTSVVEVTISSNMVAPNVMVHCNQLTDFGAFDNNAVMLFPDTPRTLRFTSKAFAPLGPLLPCTRAADFYAVSVNGLSG